MREVRRQMTRNESRAKRLTQAVEDRGAVGRPRGTSSQLIYHKVRERILALEMPARTDINELDLVEEFAVSRTPVREALIRLSSEGLVVLLPNKGAQVAPLDAEDVPKILEALELAQRVTARWAAVRRTESDLATITARCKAFGEAASSNDFTLMSDANRLFHVAIGQACGNGHLSQWFETLLNSSMRLARLAYAQAPLDPDLFRAFNRVVDTEHEDMVSALKSRNSDLSEKLARQHALLFRDRIMQYLARSGADDIKI